MIRPGFLLLVPLLSGCWGFEIPVREPAGIAVAGESARALAVGGTTRAEALEALGEPWLASRRWGFDLWRATDRESGAGVLLLLYLPVFGGVMSADWAAYALASWDAQDRLAALDQGLVSEKGELAHSSEHWLLLRAGSVVLATDSFRRGKLVLWADGDRLARYLDERAAAGACTLVLACATDTGCPDRLSVDDLAPVDPQPVTVLCREPGDCPGAGDTGLSIWLPSGDPRPIKSMPLLHALDLAPGRHRLRVASSGVPGITDFEFACAAGQARYAVVATEVAGASFLRRGRLLARATFADGIPDGWSGRGLVLWRDGHWLVVHRD
jgi:hypothetical protein